MHSREMLSRISAACAEWYGSWLRLESQPLRRDLLSGFMFENKCAHHMKNSEKAVTISSTATTVKYYRYFTLEDRLLLCANCWLQWILHLFCLEPNTSSGVKVALCVFTWGVGHALPCKRKTTLFLHIWEGGELKCHEMQRAYRICVVASFDKGDVSSHQLYWSTKWPHIVTSYLSFCRNYSE